MDATQVIRSADKLVDLVAASPAVQKDVQADPVRTLRELSEAVTKDLPTPAFVTDRVLYRGVVLALGLVAVAAMIGALLLAWTDSPTPEVVTALGAAAIGALAGLLAPSPARS